MTVFSKYDRKYGGILIYKVNNRYKILCVLQRERNKWGPPKGGIERLENGKECAKREILEETGFNIDFEVVDYKKIEIMGGTYYIIPILNILELYRNRVSVIDEREIKDIRWIDIEHIINYRTNKYMKEIYHRRYEIIKYYRLIVKYMRN